MKAQQSRRWFGFLGAGLVVAAFAGSAIAALPKTWGATDTLTANDLNGNFDAIDTRLKALEPAPSVVLGAPLSGTSITTSIPQDIPGLSVSVQVGASECVRVELAPVLGSNPQPDQSARVRVQTTGSEARAVVELVRNGVRVNAQQFGNNSTLETMAPSALSFWDMPGAGSHTYTLRAAEFDSVASGVWFILGHVRLVATRLHCQ